MVSRYEPDAPLARELQIARELQLYDHAASLVPTGRDLLPDELIQVLALYRATGRYGEAADLARRSNHQGLNVLGQRLHLLMHLGDTAALKQWIPRYRKRIEPFVEGTSPIDHGAAHLISSIALAESTLGRSRKALRTMEPLRSRIEDGAPEFRAMLFLLQRLGYFDSARDLILRVDDPDRPDGRTAEGTPRIKRLVTSGRALAAMGDTDNGIRYLRRACDLSAEPAADQGFVHPWPWRWLAHTYRINAMPERLGDIYAEVAEHRLWPEGPDAIAGLTVADGPTMRLERVNWALWAYDGTDPGVLDGLAGDLDRIGADFGSCSEYAWVLAQVHRRNDDLDALRRLAASDPDGLVQIEYARLLSQRGFHRRSTAVLDRVLASQSKHREALRLKAVVEADMRSPDDTEHDPTIMGGCLQLLEEIPEDVEVIALAAERVAQNGHFRTAERMFTHLNREVPTYGLAWAGRLRAAAWNHDWDLVAAITAEFDERRHDPGGVSDRWTPTSIPFIRFAIARALAMASRLEYRSIRDLLRNTLAELGDVDDPTYSRDDAIYLSGWEVDCLLWQERPEEARRLSEDLLLEFPGDPEILGRYGAALLACHDPRAAAAVFAQALRVAPTMGSLWKGLIAATAGQGRYDEAFDLARRALRVMENSPSILCEIAKLHKRVHRPRQGLAVIDEALKAAPYHTVALALRSKLYVDLNQYADAVDAGETARRLRPDSLDSWDALAFALLRSGDHGRALEAMHSARAHFGLDAASEQLLQANGGDESDHERHCVSPDLAVEIAVAGVLAQSGADLDECRPVIDHLRHHPSAPGALRCAAGLYRHHLRLDDALDVIESGSSGTDWRDESILLHEHAEIAAAKAFEAGFDGAQPRRGFDRADLELAEARSLHPYSVELYQTQVQLWNAQQRFDESSALLERARDRLPHQTQLQIMLAETHLMSGRPQEALRIYAALASAYAERSHMPVQLRILHITATRASGAVDKALEYAERLVADVPSSRRARVALARSLKDCNRTAEALRHLEGILSILPLYPPVAETAAMFCRLSGQHRRAHEILRTALSHYGCSDYRSEEERERKVLARADAGLLAERVLLHVAQQRFGDALADLAILQRRSDVHSLSLGDICEGWLRIKEGQPDLGLEAFRRAIRSGVNLHEARFGAAFACMRNADRRRDPETRNRHLREALAHVEASVLSPDSGRTQTVAGIAAYQLGDWERAERYFRASLKRHSVHGAHVQLAVVLNQQGRLEEALRVLERLREEVPVTARLLAIRGLTRLRLVIERSAGRSRLEAAMRDINRALDIDAQDPMVLSAVVYATSLTDMFEPAETARWIKTALRADTAAMSEPVRAELELMLAEMLLRRGRVIGRLWRWHTARWWADKAFRVSLHPRAQAIRSSRHHRRAARLSVGSRTSLTAASDNGPQEEQPKMASRVIGYTLIVLASVATLVMGVVEVAGESPNVFGIGTLILATGAVFAFGMMLTRGRLGLRLPGVELRSESPPPASELVSIPTQLNTPAPIMPHMVVAQIHNHWLPQPRFQVLGPAVGPLITGHYAYRDMYFPWRTR
jgi:tetratricopeptide (TPR) repeat protein